MRHYEFITEAEELSVPDLQSEIIGQIPQVTDFSVLDRIYQVLTQKNVSGKVEQALAFTTDGANLGKTDEIINSMMTSIANIEGTSAEKIVFVEALEADKAVNTAVLQQANVTFFL